MMYKSEVLGKGNIRARVVADSIANYVRLITLELRYPRFIHSEFMTHRMFSRNASSSRAIPVKKMIEQVESDPAMPIYWGKNQPGMQAKEEWNAPVGYPWEDSGPEEAWKSSAEWTADQAEDWVEAEYHKQIVNRLLEPFQYISTVVTATEWDNFFKLRLHEDAQPEIFELAWCMKEAMDQSEPEELRKGYYHLPYVPNTEAIPAVGGEFYDWDTAIKASVARCARVSYLNHDNTEPDIAKDVKLHNKLLEAKHMSPFENVATPMHFIDYSNAYGYFEQVEKGSTHTDGVFWWSGNFRGWTQYRQLLRDEQ